MIAPSNDMTFVLNVQICFISMRVLFYQSIFIDGAIVFIVSAPRIRLTVLGISNGVLVDRQQKFRRLFFV